MLMRRYADVDIFKKLQEVAEIGIEKNARYQVIPSV